MNYFYVDNEDYIIGYTTTKTADELKKIIPAGCRFYYYECGANLQEIAEITAPAGVGTGQRIDY